MHLFSAAFQLSAMAVFLVLTVSGAIRVSRREHANPVPFLAERNIWRGLLETTFFVLVNVWALEVVLYSIQARWAVLPTVLHTVVVDRWWAKLVGIAAIIAGTGLNIWAHRSLGGAWRLGVDEAHAGRLVTTGSYSFSRNPISLFFDLYFTGTLLLNGTLVFLLFALAAAANLHLQILEEERFLSRRFGAAYDEYRGRVGRYLTLGR